jgi:hypothetical protein
MDGIVCFNDALLSAHFDREEQNAANFQERYHEALEDAEAAVDASDLLDALFDATDEITAAIKTGKAELVGTVVMAARAAYINQSADKRAFGNGDVQGPKEAAQKVLAGSLQ